MMNGKMCRITRVFHVLDRRLKDNNCNEKILERLDAYRAKEIDALWQRSVFLGTFLVLGYTGYGFLLDRMLSEDKIEKLQLLHFLACALACVNIIFSVLWIAMAKGSKAWYESYENAINFVENAEKELTWKEVRCEIDLRRRNFEKKCKERDTDEFKNLKDNCLFSTKAGGYSPSKINIALGQISFVIWLIVLIIHITIIGVGAYEMINNECLVFLAFLISWITIAVISNLEVNECNRYIESSYFSDKKTENNQP